MKLELYGGLFLKNSKIAHESLKKIKKLDVDHYEIY
jgi:hypothetical protein